MQRRTRNGINLPMILRVIGWLLMIEATFMTAPLLTGIIYRDGSLMAFVYTILITGFSGFAMTFFIRPAHNDMGKREGFLLTALVWVIFSFFGMLPFILTAPHLNMSEAFFESMSGFTTTGASVIMDVEALPRSILMWRCLMQWIGGMGIILFTLAVIPMLNHSGGMQMFNAEVTGITHDKLRPRVSQTAKRLWAVYIVLSCTLCMLLWIGPMDFFDSVCHTLSTISTGGFSTRNASIAAWDSAYINIVLTIFMFLGGVSFALLYKASLGDVKALWRNDTFRAYIRVVLIIFVIFVICILVKGQYSTWDNLTLDPLFQIISTITSTGYTVSNFERWGPLVMALMFMLMFFGACAGSTSGGAKIDRMLYLLKNTRNELYRSVHPNSIMAVRINGKVIPAEITDKVIAFLCIYVMVIMVGGIVLTAFDIPLVDAFFSAFSCVSNTGLGAGVTGYGGSYDLIPDTAKWVLSLLMLTGRLELFTVLILFTPGFWKK
ncbi:MAG: hypothetical protein NC117_05685 [Pseudoflavonifractor sp.]|nr:hypothetical protein [Pseudoflavonifractor sp.]